MYVMVSNQLQMSPCSSVVVRLLARTAHLALLGTELQYSSRLADSF